MLNGSHFYSAESVRSRVRISPLLFLMPKTSSLLDFSSGSLPSISFQKCFRTFFTSTSLTLAHSVRALPSHSCYEKSASWIFLAVRFLVFRFKSAFALFSLQRRSLWRTSFGLCPHIRATKNPLTSQSQNLKIRSFHSRFS